MTLTGVLFINGLLISNSVPSGNKLLEAINLFALYFTPDFMTLLSKKTRNDSNFNAFGSLPLLQYVGMNTIIKFFKIQP